MTLIETITARIADPDSYELVTREELRQLLRGPEDAWDAVVDALKAVEHHYPAMGGVKRGPSGDGW